MAVTDHLSAHLFWDMKIDELDMYKHKRLIIDRVLHRGTLEEWQFINKFYSRDELIEVFTALPIIAPKEANFVKILFDLKPSQMKCYSKKQSNLNY